MVWLKVRLATMTEASIAAITKELQHFDSHVKPTAEDPSECLVTFELHVPNDDEYQALAKKCRAWTTEADPAVLVYTMVQEY